MEDRYLPHMMDRKGDKYEKWDSNNNGYNPQFTDGKHVRQKLGHP